MKLVSVVLLAASLLTGCDEELNEAKAQNLFPQPELLAQIPSATSASLAVKEKQVQAKNWYADLGKDEDRNGIWDDVDQYIDSRFKDPEQVKAMRQLARAIQNALMVPDSKELVQEDTKIWFRALDCVDKKLGEAAYYEGKMLTAEMLNSEIRSRAYIKHQELAGGFYSTAKEPVCDE